jgi:hypothetical protein
MAMLPRILTVCVIGAACFFLLSQVPDPAVFGIRTEPSTILYYGGSGLLAGLFTVMAIGSGVLAGLRRLQHTTGRTTSRLAKVVYRVALALVVVGALLVIVAFFRRVTMS